MHIHCIVFRNRQFYHMTRFMIANSYKFGIDGWLILQMSLFRRSVSWSGAMNLYEIYMNDDSIWIERIISDEKSRFTSLFGFGFSQKLQRSWKGWSWFAWSCRERQPKRYRNIGAQPQISLTRKIVMKTGRMTLSVHFTSYSAKKLIFRSILVWGFIVHVFMLIKFV